MIGDNDNGFREMRRLGESRWNRPFRFYKKIKRGRHTVTVRTELSDGSIDAITGYARLGRTVTCPWEIRLFYGKARVFVKPDDPSRPVTLKATL